jgi:hypothetical protein
MSVNESDEARNLPFGNAEISKASRARRDYSSEEVSKEIKRLVPIDTGIRVVHD